MALIDLPPELLVAIASFLGSTGSISKFARTNRRMFQVLDNYLYRYDSLAAGAAVNASLNIFKRDDEEMMGDTTYTTAISMAAMTGNAALVRILLEAGAKVNSTCFMGISVLGYAIEANNIETVHLLLAQPGIDLNYCCWRQDTALLTAVARDKLDFAELLLPLVDPNHTGNAGDTPLRLAVQQQNDSMVSLLLSDPRTNPNDMTELPSIFALACSLSSTNIVELLHDDWRTDVESSGDIEQTPASMAFVHTEFSNMDFLIRSKKCKTARHVLFCLACRHGDLEIAEKVLELATHDDEQFLERWEEAAQTAGWEELATRVAKRRGKQCGFGDPASVKAGENCDVVKYLFGQSNTEINCKEPGNEEILLCQVAKFSPTEMMRFLLQHEYPSRRDLGSKGTTTLLGFRPLKRTGISQVPAQPTKDSPSMAESRPLCLPLELLISRIFSARYTKVAPGMAESRLLCLPPELLQMVVSHFDDTASISRLCRSCSGLYLIYWKYLYRYDALLASGRRCKALRATVAESTLDDGIRVLLALNSLEADADPNSCVDQITWLPSQKFLRSGEYECVSIVKAADERKCSLLVKVLKYFGADINRRTEGDGILYQFRKPTIDLSRFEMKYVEFASVLDMDVILADYGSNNPTREQVDGMAGNVQTVRDYVFRAACEQGDMGLASLVVRLAEDDDKKHARNWIEKAELHNRHGLATSIREKWSDV
ncbi:hypothetical protein MY1884_008917 [Beauveria asiatica]